MLAMFRAEAALSPVAVAPAPDSVAVAEESEPDELAVWEAAEPEPERVLEVALAVELSELELEVAWSTVLLPH